MTRVTLQSDVIDELGSRIIDGRYRAGEMLLTEAVEREFAVSRTVAREAIKVLESMRLIAIRRAIGITILPAEQWNVFDPRIVKWRLAGPGRTQQLLSLTDLRIAIEPSAAAAFARAAGDDERQRLRRVADEMTAARAAKDLDAFVEADVRFHALVLEGSANEMFAALRGVLAVTLRLPEELSPRDELRFATLEPHLTLADHMIRGDHAAAELAAREVMSRARDEFDIPRLSCAHAASLPS